MLQSSLSYSKYFCTVDKSQDPVECDEIFTEIHFCSENLQGQRSAHRHEWKNDN